MAHYAKREPLDFWSMVLAVALGILLASTIMAVVGLLLAKAATERMARDIQQITRQAPPPPLQRPQARAQPRPVTQQRQRYVRPLEAGERCIDGVRYKREGSEWTVVRDGCR